VTERFAPLGDALEELAALRGVRGPSAVARRIREVASYPVSGPEIGPFLHGDDWPPSALMVAFRHAFGLNEEERARLAWVYTFHEEPGEH